LFVGFTTVAIVHSTSEYRGVQPVAFDKNLCGHSHVVYI